LNIIEKWHDIIKPTSRQTLLGLKQRKKNLILILSNTLTAKVAIRWIISTVNFGSIGSIEIGITRSHKNSEKLEPT